MAPNLCLSTPLAKELTRADPGHAVRMGRPVRSLIGEPSASGEEEGGGERLAIPLRVKVFHGYGCPDISWFQICLGWKIKSHPISRGLLQPPPVTEGNASPRDRLSVRYLGPAPNRGDRRTVGLTHELLEPRNSACDSFSGIACRTRQSDVGFFFFFSFLSLWGHIRPALVSPPKRRCCRSAGSEISVSVTGGDCRTLIDPWRGTGLTDCPLGPDRDMGLWGHHQHVRHEI